jgi:hypothetical protein
MPVASNPVVAHWGLGHTHKCQRRIDGKKRCGAEFIPLHQGDRMCDAHALPLGVEHYIGECASCGKQKRLYLNADWCTACLRAMPVEGREAEVLTHAEAAEHHEQQAIEAAARDLVEAERAAHAENHRRDRDAQRAAAAAERERFNAAVAASPHTDPVLQDADLERQGFNAALIADHREKETVKAQREAERRLREVQEAALFARIAEAEQAITTDDPEQIVDALVAVGFTIEELQRYAAQREASHV